MQNTQFKVTYFKKINNKIFLNQSQNKDQNNILIINNIESFYNSFNRIL